MAIVVAPDCRGQDDLRFCLKEKKKKKLENFFSLQNVFRWNQNTYWKKKEKEMKMCSMLINDSTSYSQPKQKTKKTISISLSRKENHCLIMCFIYCFHADFVVFNSIPQMENNFSSRFISVNNNYFLTLVNLSKNILQFKTAFEK